jgi:hypothetical protein
LPEQSATESQATDETGLTGPQSTNESLAESNEPYEEYVEEDEEAFLNSEAALKSGIIDKISSRNYAQGPKTEHVKSPCNVIMVAEKPSIALSITQALSNGKYS